MNDEQNIEQLEVDIYFGYQDNNNKIQTIINLEN